tara:strand:+ start:125 stop:610 length:486 start_codon:yes stop_codon:yes gene_type:complete
MIKSKKIEIFYFLISILFFFSCSEADENIDEEITSEEELFLEKLDGTVWNHSLLEMYEWDWIGFDKDETNFITYKDDQEGYDFCLILGIGEQTIDGSIYKVAILKHDKNELSFNIKIETEETILITFKIIDDTKIEYTYETDSEKDVIDLYLKRGESNLTC